MSCTDETLKTQATALLKRFYGYASFRPMQWEIISSAVHGRDTLVLMPTGGGKSLCYQLPALMSDYGCAIVVSPLLALMNDQIDALLENGIPVRAINSEKSDIENRETVDLLLHRKVKLIYISPEKLLSELNYWSSTVFENVVLFAIDEAHCISHWGHDFRPEYSQLGLLKEKFPSIPIMALTATADRITRDDIATQLHLRDVQTFVSSFDRPNLALNVIQSMGAKQKFKQIVQIINSHKNESGIIYSLSRRSVEKLAGDLQRLGINAQAFHAGMSSASKLKIQRDFINDDIQVVCATVAFGMGIDKSNVRFVIHHNMPQNFESYYQEIGRAGRDGLPAEAFMFYSYGDVIAQRQFALKSGQIQINLEKLQRMQQYAESHICRRRILLSYFNERYDHDCHNCDICNHLTDRFDGTTYAQMALSAIKRTHEHASLYTIADILLGWRKSAIVAAGYDRLKTFGIGRELSMAEWNAYLLQMLQMGLFEVAYDQGNHLKITSYGYDVLFGKQSISLNRYQPRDLAATNQSHSSVFNQELSARDQELFEKLRILQKAIAQANHVAPYMILHDKTLRLLAQQKPTTKSAFGIIDGIGVNKCEKYCQSFTAVIKQHLETSVQKHADSKPLFSQEQEDKHEM